MNDDIPTDVELVTQMHQDQGGAIALVKLALDYLGASDPSNDDLQFAAQALAEASKLSDSAARNLRRSKG